MYVEAKAAYGKDMVTAFIKLNGTTVGAVANRTTLYDAEGNVVETYEPVISARGAKKAADFVGFCDAFPFLSLHLPMSEAIRPPNVQKLIWRRLQPS